MLLALFTELRANGGIQRMNRHFGAAFGDLSAASGEALCLMSLNDTVGTHEMTVGGSTFRFTGYGRDKFRFFAAAAARMSQADLVFIGHPNFAGLSLAARIRRGSRVWCQAYGVEVWTPLSSISRWALRNSDLVTGISAHTNEMLEKVQGVDPARLGLLPPALDPVHAETSEVSVSGPGKGPELLTVSRLDVLDPYKGIEAVVEAVGLLQAEFPNLRYTIVGEGSDRPRLQALVDSAGLASRVRFLGALSDEELRRVYAGCDVFILPSMREGFGIVYLEAMAKGKPVVGMDCAGTRDVIRDGFNGLMLASEQPEYVAGRLAPLLRDADTRLRLGANGKEFSKGFSLDSFRSKIAKLARKEAECASSM